MAKLAILTSIGMSLFATTAGLTPELYGRTFLALNSVQIAIYGPSPARSGYADGNREGPKLMKAYNWQHSRYGKIIRTVTIQGTFSADTSLEYRQSYWQAYAKGLSDRIGADVTQYYGDDCRSATCTLSVSF